MIGFHVPSCLIDCGNPVPIRGDIAGHQIVDAGRTILGCEAVCDAQEWNGHTFHVTGDRVHRFQFQRVHSLLPSLLLGFHTQSHCAIACEWQNDLLVEGAFDNFHSFSSSKPAVIEHISERNLVFHGLCQYIAVPVVFGVVRATLFFPILWVTGALRLPH